MIVTKGNVLVAKMERPVFIWLQKFKGVFWVNSSSHGNTPKDFMGLNSK